MGLKRLERFDNIVLALCLSIFLILTLLAQSGRNQQESVEANSSTGQPIIYVDDYVKANSSTIPKQLSILKVISKELTREDAVKIASIFGIEGEMKYSDLSDLWVIKNGSKEISVFKIGYIYLRGVEIGFSEKSLSGEWLPEAEYIALAKKFFEEVLRPNHLIPETIRQFKIEVVADKTIIHYGNDSDVEYWNNVHVNFIPIFDGVRILSNAAEIRVYFNRQGQVTGFITFFWEVKPLKTVSIITPEEAIGKLKEKFPNGSVEIESIDFVYFSLGFSATELVPSYIITGKHPNPVINETFYFRENIPAIKE